MENKEISSPDPRVSFGADKGYELMPTREIIVDGQSVGIISLRLPSEGNFCEITEIALLDQYQGKGLGKEALLMLDQELKSKNMILVSGKDQPITPEGRKLWESLVKSGEVEYLPADEFGPRYKFKG